MTDYELHTKRSDMADLLVLIHSAKAERDLEPINSALWAELNSKVSRLSLNLHSLRREVDLFIVKCEHPEWFKTSAKDQLATQVDQLKGF